MQLFQNPPSAAPNSKKKRNDPGNPHKLKTFLQKHIPFDPSTTPERPPNDPSTNPDRPRILPPHPFLPVQRTSSRLNAVRLIRRARGTGKIARVFDAASPPARTRAHRPPAPQIITGLIRLRQLHIARPGVLLRAARVADRWPKRSDRHCRYRRFLTFIAIRINKTKSQLQFLRAYFRRMKVTSSLATANPAREPFATWQSMRKFRPQLCFLPNEATELEQNTQTSSGRKPPKATESHPNTPIHTQIHPGEYPIMHVLSTNSHHI